VNATTAEFLNALLRRCPSLSGVLEEHKADMEGEVLSHLFMADVERWAERNADREVTNDLIGLFDLP
jgi:hypothetical protein